MLIFCFLALSLVLILKNNMAELRKISDDEPPSLEHTDILGLSKSSNTDIDMRNLQKLCKVWGYVKYNHPVFLLGQKDWDDELLSLIPLISDAKTYEDANDILYKWYLGLGDIEYNTDIKVPKWATATEEDKRIIADINWIEDEDYLGIDLSEALSALETIPNISRKKAPVEFDVFYDTSIFPNEKSYEGMDFADKNYSLLGLFRA